MTVSSMTSVDVGYKNKKVQYVKKKKITMVGLKNPKASFLPVIFPSA